MDVGFLDHRRQCLLRQPPGLQERREVAAPPELRDPQLHRPGLGLPVPLPIAVPLHQALGAALAVSRAGDPAHLQFHQPLGGEADHLPQEGRIRAFRQHLAKGSLVVGHRGRSKVRVAGLSNPTLPRTAAVTAHSSTVTSYTTPRDTTPGRPHWQA